MVVKECRFINVKDPYDGTKNWSRPFEWFYAKQAAIECLSPFLHANRMGSLLNAACGCSEIHKSFQDQLLEIAFTDLFNCDTIESSINKNFSNFFLHDITKPFPDKYDCCLCISTVEDFVEPTLIKQVFNNLLDATNKRLIITCDINEKVSHKIFIDILGLPKDWDFKEEGALTGSTSSFQQHEFANLRVLLIDIIKEN